MLKKNRRKKQKYRISSMLSHEHDDKKLKCTFSWLDNFLILGSGNHYWSFFSNFYPHVFNNLWFILIAINNKDRICYFKTNFWNHAWIKNWNDTLLWQKEMKVIFSIRLDLRASILVKYDKMFAILESLHTVFIIRF